MEWSTQKTAWRSNRAKISSPYSEDGTEKKMTDERQRINAANILFNAKVVVTTQRGNQHGGADDSFQMIGNLWSEYLRATTTHRAAEKQFVGVSELAITPTDVAHMMTILKIARANLGDPSQVDNYIDAAGYQSLAGALSLGSAMVVPAVSADEQNKADIEARLQQERQKTRVVKAALDAAAAQPTTLSDILKTTDDANAEGK
jgi:hypothetical protein